MRKLLAVLLAAALALSWGCWGQSTPKPTTKPSAIGGGSETGANDTGPSGKGTGRTQETLPDR